MRLAEKRWNEFHRARLARYGRSSVALRLIPPGTRRFSLAKALIGPLTPSPVRTTAPTACIPVAITAAWTEQVLVVTLSDSPSSDELVAASTAIATASQEWVIFVDSSDEYEDIGRAVSHLLPLAATDPAGVHFCGDRDNPHKIARISRVALESFPFQGRATLYPRGSIASLSAHPWRHPEHQLALDLLGAGRSFHRHPGWANVCSLPTPHDHWTPDATRPSVDIVIPTRDRVDLLAACIESIERVTTHPYRIIIVDNDSTDPETIAYFSATPHLVAHYPGPFNYSAIVNHGARQGSGEVIVTLNNDTLVHGANWLSRLAHWAIQPDVGVVGARLEGVDGVLQHDGMAIIPYPVELNDGEPISDIPRGVLSEGARRSVRSVGAVTGAVSAIERSKWELVSGLDESLRVIGNDVDLCLRLAERGYDSVIDPHVTLTHVGKASRRGNDGDGDNFRMIARWNMLGPDGLIDPFYPDMALPLGDAR